MSAIERILEEHEDLADQYLGKPWDGAKPAFLVNRFHAYLDLALSLEHRGEDPTLALVRGLAEMDRRLNVHEQLALDQALRTVPPMVIAYDPAFGRPLTPTTLPRPRRPAWVAAASAFLAGSALGTLLGSWL